MSRKPLVSIIIVNFNGKEFIKQCLDSVLASQYPFLEVIVVDNASTDNSLAYLKRLYSLNPRVRLFGLKEQQFFTGGSNYGACQARGEKLVFLNSDTVVKNDWLGPLVKIAARNPRLLVQPKILFYSRPGLIDNTGGQYIFPGFGRGIGRGEKDHGQYDQNRPVDFVNGTCFLIDKAFFEQLGGFDEWYRFHYEDVDLSLRAKKKTGQTWYCWESVVYHKGSLSVKKNLGREELLFHVRKNRLRTIVKNFKGGKKYLRLTAMLVLYFALAVQDLISTERKAPRLTINSITTVIKERGNES